MLKRQWLAKWKRDHTLELAEQFLRLYGHNVRAAEPDIYPGRVYGGRAAGVNMTAGSIENLLGGCDDGTDSYLDYRLNGTDDALLRVEDPRLAGEPDDTVPVTVKVVWVFLEGTGTVGE